MSEFKNLFLAPRSSKQSYSHFKSTIDYGIPYESIVHVLDDEGKSILSKEHKIFAWGCHSGLKTKWDRMKKGDYVLFYIRGVFRYVGTVIYKKYSTELSDALWPRKDEEPWSCVFFLNDLKEIYVPLEIINELAGYKLTRLQGFQPLNEKGVRNIYSKYGDPDNFFIT